ncbi:hypothetical protein B9S53_11990 [Arthrospira sp. O9.13F]|nr:hypothetical protein B9S53_11990 [Arthrospira sp. O9.13F]
MDIGPAVKRTGIPKPDDLGLLFHRTHLYPQGVSGLLVRTQTIPASPAVVMSRSKLIEMR